MNDIKSFKELIYKVDDITALERTAMIMFDDMIEIYYKDKHFAKKFDYWIKNGSTILLLELLNTKYPRKNINFNKKNILHFNSFCYIDSLTLKYKKVIHTQRLCF